MIEEENELNDSRTFVYDAANNLVEKTDRNGRVTEYEFDHLHRLIEERWLDDEETVIHTITYVFDSASQLVETADADSDSEFVYNGLGLLTTFTTTIADITGVFTQQFDAAGRRTQLIAEVEGTDDFVNAYTRDNLGRLTRVTQQGQGGGNAVSEKRVDLGYNAAGQFMSIVRYKDVDGGGGNLVAESELEYDGIGRLTDLTHFRGETTIDAFGWTYDAASRITQFTGSVDGTTTYGYDHTSQLTSADHSYQTDETFEYDENGNRTMAGYTVGPNNQLLSDGTWDYEYDGEGNTVRKERISSDPAADHSVEYVWDHRNRLISVVYKDNSGDVTMSALYVYDTFNRRIGKTVDEDGDAAGDAWSEYYFYDPLAHAAGPGDSSHVALVVDDEGDVKHRLLHGDIVDQVFADESAIDGTLWALTDHQGTIRDLLDSDGEVVNHIQYGAFGNITDETAAKDFLFYYAGRQLDRETGQQENRARYYNPTIGKWMSEDPLGFAAGDGNLGRYLNNSPINAVDPSGLIRWGHHWVPRSVITDNSGILSQEAVRYLWQAVTDPGLFDHGADMWNGIRHVDYTSSVDQLLKNYADAFAGGGKLTQEQAKSFVRAIMGGDVSDIRGLTTFLKENSGLMKTIAAWRKGFLESITIARAAQETASQLGLTLTKDDYKALAQLKINGAVSDGLASTYNARSLKAIEDAWGALGAKGLKDLFKRSAFKMLGSIIGIISGIAAANRGYAGEGRVDEGGAWGAFCEVNADVVAADLVEPYILIPAGKTWAQSLWDLFGGDSNRDGITRNKNAGFDPVTGLPQRP